MRELSKEKVISCQLSYYPLGKEDFIQDIDNVLDIISKSGLDYTVGEMATVIKGETAKVYDLLNQISDTMAHGGNKYTMSLTISNTCGF